MGSGADENRVLLTGSVHRKPETRTSPAGIPISRFGLEHRSEQSEAGMKREAQARIVIVASGKELQPLVRTLETGSKVRVTGFLSRSSFRDPEVRLELHAQQIELLS